MSDITIRALMQIDNLQPKFAAYNGATVQGSIPLSGDTVLIGELAPGNGVFQLIDRGLDIAARTRSQHLRPTSRSSAELQPAGPSGSQAAEGAASRQARPA